MRWFYQVPTICIFEQKYEKHQNFLSENFQFLVVKLVFVMLSIAPKHILWVIPMSTYKRSCDVKVTELFAGGSSMEFQLCLKFKE